MAGAVAKELAILISGSDRASPALRQMQKELQGIGTAAGVAGQGSVTAGQQMRTAMGGALASITPVQLGMAGLGIGAVMAARSVASSAIGFESAFAGVRKTVDATEAEFAQLSSGIRDMAKHLPASREEIARVAEAAGQLGIQKDAILGFSKVMIDLGIATNMSSDQAATALARLANITQMPQTEFSRLGSTVVDLGNKFAATESEIVDMSLRIAGAGKQIGLSEAQILSWATALSNVGIEVEAGGSAISRTFIDIAKAVSKGGDDLELFAQVAGMSAQEYATLFRRDANEATLVFVEGLARLKDAGGDMLAVLEDLGITEVRQRMAVLNLVTGHAQLRDVMDVGNKAWQENIALVEEANKRYATMESKLTIAQNKLSDIGVTIGSAVLPPMVDLLGLLVDFAATPFNLVDINYLRESAAAFDREREAVIAAGGGFDEATRAALELNKEMLGWNKTADENTAKFENMATVVRDVSVGMFTAAEAAAIAADGFGNMGRAADTAASSMAKLKLGETPESSPAWFEYLQFGEDYKELQEELDKLDKKRASTSAQVMSSAASDAGRLASEYDRLSNDARKLGRTIEEDLGDAMSRAGEIGEESGQRWIEKWFDVDDAIRKAQQSAADAVAAMEQQDIISGSTAARRRALGERLSDEDYHYREAKNKEKALRDYQRDLSRASNGEERRAAEQRYNERLEDIRLAHLDYDEDVQHRIRQDAERAKLEKELHDEETARRRSAIEAEKEAKIKAINDEWSDWEKTEANKTAKAIAEAKATAVGKLNAIKADYFDKLAEAAAPGLDALRQQIADSVGTAIAALTTNVEGSGGGGGGGGYTDPRHLPGGDIFEAWRAAEPRQYDEWLAEHPEYQGMDIPGAVRGPWGSPQLVLARGGEQFSGFPPRDAGMTVTVYVQGSVISERDLVGRIRDGLLDLGRRNLSIGLS